MDKKTRLAVLAAGVVTAVVVIALAATTYAQPGVTVARGGECISELAVAVGSDGAAQLEKDGFTVMGRPLCDGSEAYVAYKKGGTPITGIAASAGNGGLAVNGVNYNLVGDADLCAGVKGQTYLYATNDGASGPGVVSIAVDSSEGAVDDAPLALRNDGTSPLRDESGRPVDFGAGAPAYAFVLREGVVRPYVSDLRAVSGADLRGAVLEAAAAGFDYYYDPGLTTLEGSYVVIGYNRTADANAAVTCVTARPAGEQAFEAGGVAFERKGDVVLAEAVPYVLFATRDHAAGNPILDFTGSGVPVRATDVLGKWSERTFVKFASAAPAQQAKAEPLYGDLMKSKSELAHVAVLMASGDSAQVEQPVQQTQATEAPSDRQPTDDEPSDQEQQPDQTQVPQDHPEQSAQSDQAFEVVVEGEDVPAADIVADAQASQKATGEDGTGASASVEDAKSNAEPNGVTTSLAYVCVAADMPASLFGKASDATLSKEVAAKTEAVSETAVRPQEQSGTAEAIELAQDTPTGGEAQFEKYVDDFDQATYLNAQPEVITLGGNSEDFAASVFGSMGAAGTLAVAGGMAVAGALAGLVVYVVVKRRKEARHDE